MIEIIAIPSIVLFVSFLWVKFPPKNVNYIYGYRTSSSMKNSYMWYWANFFSSRYLVFWCLINLISNIIVILFIKSIPSNLINALVIIFVIGLLAIIPVTEIFLSKLKKQKNESNKTQT